MMAETQLAASRLCRSCGMCCDGSLFQSVVLQPGDSERELAAGGLKLERQKGVVFFRQPCSALDRCDCRIYEKRPSGCREFVCRLVAELDAGGIAEGEAATVIKTATDLRSRLIGLLELSGDNDGRLPLSTRYQKALERPADLASMKTRARLMVVATSFAELLEERFRVDAP